MTPLFKKLNLKDQETVFIMDAPDSFQTEIKAISESRTVQHKPTGRIDFVLIFVLSKEEIDTSINQIETLLSSDAVLWYCYPKKSSKKYTTDISRDHGWEKLGELDYEGVRMVAIDSDWSALRFRKVDKIKIMKRNFAISQKGEERIKKNKKS